MRGIVVNEGCFVAHEPIYFAVRSALDQCESFLLLCVFNLSDFLNWEILQNE